MVNRVIKTLYMNLQNITGKYVKQIQLMLTPFFKDEVNSRLAKRSVGDCDMESYNIDLSSIVSHIGRLKCNKSAGHDGIVSEHVVFGGHCLVIHICLLFNAMLKHSSVANDFCRGILVPLLKCNKKLR